PASAARPNFVSPFAADSARKGTPRQEASSNPVPQTGPRIVATASVPEPVIMGSAAPAPMRDSSEDASVDLREGTGYGSAGVTKPSVPEPQPASQAQQPQVATAVAQAPMDHVQNAVLQALTDGNQRVLVSMLSEGEWSLQGNELVIKIAESQTVVDMSLSSDAKRLAIASASGVLGRAVKLRVVPGVAVTPQESK